MTRHYEIAFKELEHLSVWSNQCFIQQFHDITRKIEVDLNMLYIGMIKNLSQLTLGGSIPH
ncbi:hypothetical protein NS2R_19870 [Pseudomonas oryzihabitans]|nr:hypothetical protein NS2R_19870 [Pseudomonas psychrotolerans]